MVTPAPQDKWSQDKHIDLVNITGIPGARMLTRALAKELSDASAHESIRIFLAFATYMNFIVYQIDVKSAFLNGKLKEEVYVKQPPGFESSEFPNHVCKLDKSLYGLKQALRAWYLKGTPSLGMWCPKCSGFNLKGYSDFDYAGCNMDRKSTSGACQLLGGKLVCWSAKKQQSVAMGPELSNFIPTQYQLADIFTKPLDEPTFKRLIVKLGGIRGEIGITTFRNALRAHYLPQSSRYVTPPSLAVCLGGKSGGHDQISNKDAIILYCLANGLEVNSAKIIWEDLILKLNKKTREQVILYPRFISLLLEYMMPEYDNEVLTLNPTQQADGGQTSLEAISEEGAHPQLSSGTNPSVLVDKTKSVGDGLKITHTDLGTNEESRSDEISKKINLEDLSDLMQDTRSAFLTPDSSQDEPIIVSDESEE
ncbi:retrovirus-related pol polyprotein from transposon TNT 1-94 [Tanacetum coccineum]